MTAHPPSISLLDRPHAEARRLASSGAPVWLSVNPVEYHGPHLPLHNDRLVSTALIRLLHSELYQDKDLPLLLGADLEVGVEPCPGPGSRHTSYRVVRDLVIDAGRRLADLGVRKVVLVTFHGAPLHNLALEAAVRDLRKIGVRAVAPFHVVLRQQLDLDPTRFEPAFAHLDEEARNEARAELKWDFHAGFFETSVVMHLDPEAVSPIARSLPPCPPIPRDPGFHLASRLAGALGAETLSAELAFAAAGVGWHAIRPFPGYTGRPDRAHPAAGAVFVRAILDSYAPVLRGTLEGEGAPPKPIMPWAAALSLGGRIGAAPRLGLADVRVPGNTAGP